MTAAKRILKYLNQTKDLNLTYVRNSPEALVGYSDADWAGDVQDRRSTSGNVFLLGGGAIAWSSRKQSLVALSTVEAEYMALSVATQEAIWLRHLQEELGVSNTVPTLIFEDNQGVISMAKNPDVACTDPVPLHKRSCGARNNHPRVLPNRRHVGRQLHESIGS